MTYQNATEIKPVIEWLIEHYFYINNNYGRADYESKGVDLRIESTGKWINIAFSYLTDNHGNRGESAFYWDKSDTEVGKIEHYVFDAIDRVCAVEVKGSVQDDPTLE
jgi:hypothetical protein